eukprot:821986-Prorocentrum_minimum.AAC.2
MDLSLIHTPIRHAATMMGITSDMGDERASKRDGDDRGGGVPEIAAWWSEAWSRRFDCCFSHPALS